MNNRVVVSGIGLVSAIGHDYSTVLDALKAGTSGIKPMVHWAQFGLKSLVAGPIVGLDEKLEQARIPKKLALGMSDAAIYCSLAAKDAVVDSGLTPNELQDQPTGCIVGSGIGSVSTVVEAGELLHSGQIRRIKPYVVLRSMSSSTSAAVANLLGIEGRSYSLSSACATSAHNIGHAVELIQHGVLERALAGGGEDVNELLAASFQALRLALSTRYNQTPAKASRPYDAGRDGFVLSGGAGILLLESMDAARARGARIRAEIIGYGANTDAYDMVLPEPGGRQAAACMKQALDNARIAPDQVDAVNTHGTSTVHGDIAELRALETVFGKDMPRFSSTKSMTGHPVGAAGALELIFCIGMIEHGFIAPSINVEHLDEAAEGLPIVTSTLFDRIDTVLSNSFGFGGANAVILVRKYDE